MKSVEIGKRTLVVILLYFYSVPRWRYPRFIFYDRESENEPRPWLDYENKYEHHHRLTPSTQYVTSYKKMNLIRLNKFNELLYKDKIINLLKWSIYVRLATDTIKGK